jgi:outer membrane protein assembly factor BamB
MKSLILIFTTLIIVSCSFDNKTGIWIDASNVLIENNNDKSINAKNIESSYEILLGQNEIFNEEKESINRTSFTLEQPIRINNWFEEYATSNNNVSNYLYSGKKILISKGSKLNKNNLSTNIVFYEDYLITHDQKGKIFIYSINLKKKIFVYDFYKKNFRNFKKKIYLIINKDILYAADNLGYIYAINLKTKSLIWAKNYGIPFRSNLKIDKEQIFLANQDNVIYSINTYNGEIKWQFATNVAFLKSDFINNFVLDKLNNNLFFLNTNGELYSVSYTKQKINWTVNFKSSSQINSTDIFIGKPVVIKNENLVVVTDKKVLNFNKLTGVKSWSFPSDSILKPVVTDNYTYILSKSNLLICIDNKTGNVLWSKNIFYTLLDQNMMTKTGKFYDLKIVNNKLNLFSNKGYLLIFNYNSGNLELIKKISKNGIKSKIIFLKENMYLIDKTNKLLKFN